MESRTKPWEGSATQLAKELQTYGLEEPADPRAFSVALRKLASALRSGFGISLEFPHRRSDVRLIRLSKVR